MDREEIRQVYITLFNLNKNLPFNSGFWVFWPYQYRKWRRKNLYKANGICFEIIRAKSNRK